MADGCPGFSVFGLAAMNIYPNGIARSIMHSKPQTLPAAGAALIPKLPLTGCAVRVVRCGHLLEKRRNSGRLCKLDLHAQNALSSSRGMHLRLLRCERARTVCEHGVILPGL